MTVAGLAGLLAALSAEYDATSSADIVPVALELHVDAITPVGVCESFIGNDCGFLLESVEGGERQGRYSFIGTEPYRVYGAQHEDGDPLDVVQQELARH
mgnify:CR=1 FL=1